MPLTWNSECPFLRWRRLAVDTFGRGAVRQGRGLGVPGRRAASWPRATMQARYLEGLLGIVVWFLWTRVAGLLVAPAVVYFLVLAVAVLLSADAVAERPLFSRLQVRPSTRRVIAVASGFILVLFGFAAVSAVMSPIPNIDPPVTLLCAAQNLRQGVVPYTTYEPQCYRQVGYKLLNATPLEAGPFAHDAHYPSTSAQLRVLRRDQQCGTNGGFPAFGYPPDAALLLLPVAFTSWTVVSLWVAIVCGVLLVLIWWVAVPDRALLLSWQLAGLGLPVLGIGWNPELISYLLLALAFAISMWPRRSAVALAAAVCTNPLAWVAAPVYFAIMSRYPEFWRRLAWVSAAVAAGLLPWLFWDHRLVVQMWRFVAMPEFPVGVAIGIFAHLPARSHSLYLAGFIAAVVGAALCAWRFKQWRWSFAVAVYLAFMVSWRAPVYYYFAAFWLAPAVFAGRCRYHSVLRQRGIGFDAERVAADVKG